VESRCSRVPISTLIWGPAARVRDQLAALADADAWDIEVLIATDGPIESPLASSRLLTTAGLGRRAAWKLAADAAAGEVLVVVDQLAEPTVSAIVLLAAAVDAGAALAGPVIATANTTIFGYSRTDDGALWPCPTPIERPAALALDCLAAPRAFFASVPAWDAIAGPPELQLTAHARSIGPVEIVADARVQRRSSGPTLSVIVCTRNRVDEIAECVASCLALDLAGNDAELIVVDNGSTDATGPLLDELARTHGARVRIAHEPVPGLSRARNTGAAASQADVVCFLDDDARPCPGWLEHLRLAFSDPGVAIAGGPICGLWPDGRPAGFPPLNAAPYFGILDRGDAPHDSARPEDGPWGGNWAVRRQLIDQIEGFDVRFGAGEEGNLGGEEVHFGWRVLERGLGRLRFEPGAAIGHRSPSARVREDYVLLRAYRCGIEDIRMRHVLARESEDEITTTAGIAAARLSRFAYPGLRDVDAALATIIGADASLEARIDAAGALGQIVGVASARSAASVAIGPATLTMRPEHAGGRVRPRSGAVRPEAEILVCYPDVPDPTRSAGHARAFELLQSLVRLGRQPVLFTLGSAGADETLARLAAQGVEVHCADRGARFADLAARQFPGAIVSFWDIAERMLPVLRAASPRTRIVVDSVDLHFRRMTREADLLGDAAKRAAADAVRIRELAVYLAADVVLAVSDDEQEAICDLLPGLPVGLLPTVHHPLALAQAPAGRRGALFVGSYGHAPNVDAVRFLCDAVIPALRDLGSDAPVAVAGYAMPDELAEYARAHGAEVLGFLPSVEDVLEHTRMSIAPLRFGAGLKGKVGESLAAGVPVVGTQVAAEGFGDAAEGMLVADDPAAFARAIARLATDDALWQRLSDGGRALIAKTCGPDRCDQELTDVLEFLQPALKAA
jgi:GT2 family glycosyltransferase/glycosyltransferase involved in cell wall biosynthesis